MFHKLEKEHLKEIVSLMIDQLRERLSDQNIHIEVTEKATERIAEEGYDPEYGARPLARSIQKNIEDTLSESLLSGESFENKLVTVDYKNDEFTVETKDRAADTVEQP